MGRCPPQAYDSKCVHEPTHHQPIRDGGSHPDQIGSVFADPKDVERRRWNRRVVGEFGLFLRRYRWHLFISMDGPTDRDLTAEMAQAIAHRWVELAGKDVYAYAVYERGDIKDRGHLHLLVGGPIFGGAVHRIGDKKTGQWMWRYADRDFPITGWNWGFGRTEIVVRHVDLFDPKRGAPEYVVKNVVEHPEHGWWIGKPRRPRRRKRGR